MTKQMKCIKCNRILEPVMKNTPLQPYGGTIFTTNGHYGSTCFDPMTNEYLEIFVCDPCLIIEAENKKIYNGRGEEDPEYWVPSPNTIDWVKQCSES